MAFTTLISTTELSRHLAEQDWIVLDCRHDLAHPEAGRSAYAEGHIPHALFAHLDDDLSGAQTGADQVFRGRHPLPERADFVATLRRWGISDQTQVVAYDAHGGMFAARLWWMLRWVGHEAVAVLDGGLPLWQAHGLPVSTSFSSHRPGHLSDKPALTASVSAADVLDNLASGARTIIDARAPDRFHGENETIDPIGGHIPGAKNRFFKENLQPDGSFKSAEQLSKEFHALIDQGSSAIMQCGSGISACHNLLALEVAGLPGAALYPGSWSEWCADGSRPIA